MVIEFTVLRKPVSVNAGYARAGWHKNRGPRGGTGLILTEEAVAYKAAIFSAAFAAARQADWPKIERVERVAVEIKKWNTKHDIDAACKFTLDGMEGAVYVKDDVVRPVLLDMDDDDGPPRVQVRVTLTRERQGRDAIDEREGQASLRDHRTGGRAKRLRSSSRAQEGLVR